MRKKRTQYIAVDFLHDDFTDAAHCAGLLANGGLEYSLTLGSRDKENIDGLHVESLYSLTRQSLDHQPTRQLSLVAKVAFHGNGLDPDIMRPQLARIGKDTRNKGAWLSGASVRVAKLFSYGSDIFRTFDDRQLRETTIPIWRDAGCPKKHRKIPAQNLGEEFFSLNTSRAEPHWVGHIREWQVARLQKRHPEIVRRATDLQMLTIERL